MLRWLVFLVCLVGTGGGLLAEKLTIYCEDDPPNQIITSDGRLTGMTVEIVREIQQRVGNQDPITVVPWARGFDAVQKNPNTVLFSMSRTAERNPLFNWIGPVLETSYGFYARADSSLSITSLEEAKGLKRIGVYLNRCTQCPPDPGGLHEPRPHQQQHSERQEGDGGSDRGLRFRP